MPNGTIDVGSSSAQTSVTLNYTGPGETTDRSLNIVYNGNLASAGHTINASGTGPLKFTSAFTLTPSAGTGFLILSGSGIGELSQGFSTMQSSGLSKQGTGTWILSGASTFNRPTTVAAGTLVARDGSALGSGANTNVNITAGAALNYYASSDTALNIGGTLTINGGTGTTIGGSIGSTATSARINVGGNALVPTAAVAVNVYGVSGVSRLAGTNTYTLVSGGGGGATTLNSGTYTLGTVYNNTDFTVSNIQKSTTDLKIDVTKQTALTNAYFVGGLAGAGNVWAASNGSTRSNFATTSGGVSQSLVPGSGADVFVDNTSSASNTVLGADMSIKSLTISDNTNNFAINADGYGLTIGTGGITKSNTTTRTASINSNVILGASQAWSNSDTGNALVVSGIVSGANNLTVTGAGNTTISGRLMIGTGTLAKNGNGTLTLANHNTYNGATTVNAGTLSVSGFIGSSAVTVSNSGTILASGPTGTIGNTVAINNGAILAAGGHSAAGIATALGAATFNNGSVFSWDINAAGTGYDKLIAPSLVDGDSVGGSVFRIVVADSTFANPFWSADQQWTDIFTTNGTTAISSWTSLFSVSVVNSSFSPLNTSSFGTFSISGSNLNWTAIPEPSTTLGGLLLTAGLLRRRRRHATA